MYNDLHIFAPNTLYKKRTIKYKCSILWNCLPDKMKVCSSIKAFKRTTKNLISLYNDND